MKTIEKRAREAFCAINKEEYQCALAESQVSEELFEQVKKEYGIAENAFVQGVVYENNRNRDKHMWKPEERLPVNGVWVLAYCNTEGYEDCYVEPEVVWYNEVTKEWHTKGGEKVVNVNCWFEIPEL